jgi:hypothetical protein
MRQRWIAGEDEDVARVPEVKVPQVLPHGVGGALVPQLALQRLPRREDLHRPAGERVERVGAGDVTMKARGVKLRDDEDTLIARVEAVADGDVNQPVLPAQRNRRLAALLREREQARPAPAAEDAADHVAHVRHLRNCPRGDSRLARKCQPLRGGAMTRRSARAALAVVAAMLSLGRAFGQEGDQLDALSRRPRSSRPPWPSRRTTRTRPRRATTPMAWRCSP